MSQPSVHATSFEQHKRNFLNGIANVMAKRGTPLPPTLTGTPSPNYDPNNSPWSYIEPSVELGCFRLVNQDVSLFKLWGLVMQHGGAQAVCVIPHSTAHLRSLFSASLRPVTPGLRSVPSSVYQKISQIQANGSASVPLMVEQIYTAILYPFEDLYKKDIQERQRRAQMESRWQMFMGQSGQLSPVPQSGMRPSSDLLKMLACILRKEDSQKHLCSLKGGHTQAMVDYLDSVLLEPVLPETWLRKHCLIALYKLSKHSLLYPHCYVLKESITFGSYEGGGTFSDIYRGRLGEKDLCLKVVRLHQKSDTDAMLKVYAKEAILWSQPHHPNITPFYGICYVNEMRRQLCLVSPWMHRGNLVEYLRRNSSATRTPFVYDVTSGLEYLHSQGLVHSDLKGVNILVNDLERACITDFGLSFIRTDNTLPYAIASSMTHGFTHRWAAPELFEDGARPTMASDMWAFGCVCYEILTGLVPFHNLGEVQIVRALISGKAPKRPNATPDTTAAEIIIWEQVDRCWSAEPDDRPKCLQFLSALQSFGLSYEIPAEAQDDESEEQNYWAAIRKGGNKPIDLGIVKKILVELNTLTHISNETQDV